MCGIFGISGKIAVSSVDLCIAGLKKLEYRGYDSSGIALLNEGQIEIVKSCGKVESLEKRVLHLKDLKSVSIAHTRWATHGGVVEVNAHPHVDNEKKLALVHNGIIENFYELKLYLEKNGVQFLSDTDTEVIAHLFSHFYDSNLLNTLKRVHEKLIGSFAVACIHKDHPNTLIVTKRDKPLILAVDQQKGQIIVTSDRNALYEGEFQTVDLEDNQIALINENTLQLYDQNGLITPLQFTPLFVKNTSHEKGEFSHFMLKEIHEQPNAIRRTLEGRYDLENGQILLNLPKNFKEFFPKVSKIALIGCGTSYHAACICAHFIEEFVRIPAQAHIASEFRYKEGLTDESTLVIGISQSGETADTIGALREAKRQKAKIFCITNVQHSSIIRESDFHLMTQAGPEISVCSTKAFTSQLLLLYLLTLEFYQMKHGFLDQGNIWIQNLRTLPGLIESVLQKKSLIQEIAKQTCQLDKVLFIGRQYMFYTALESSLKLKEISYIFSLCYPAGELKHGPLALVDENTLTIALLGHAPTFQKTCSNVQEIQARKGKIFAIAQKNQNLEEISPDFAFKIDASIAQPLLPILYSVVLQLYAFYVALEKGHDIDHPKNLAKSVTVE
jgi:glucosamine--fructose-6-phosphate aminotransferase (isomerizing)